MILETMPNSQKENLKTEPRNKKWVWIVAIALVLVLIVFALMYYYVFSKDWRGRWLTYENSRFGYSIDYPVDWVLGEAPTNNDGRDIYSPNKEAYCSVYGFTNALISDSGKAQTLDEFIDWMLLNEDNDLIARENTKIDGENAVLVHYQNQEGVTKAVYALNQEEGIGFWCNYSSSELAKKYLKKFDAMVLSIKTNQDFSGGSLSSENSCQNLLSGVTIPLKDLETFSDDQYTDVSMTDRESWDQDKLPKRVVDLEQEGYVCLPTPTEFENQESPGIDSEPVTTDIEWSCELDYNDWKYLAKDSSELDRYQTSGYSCQEEICLNENNQSDTVYFCTL